jgi:hypothetical protein
VAAHFETDDASPDARLRPLRVAMLPNQVFEAACEMVEDLPGWQVLERDPGALRLECRRAGGALVAPARITIACEGDPGIPSTTVRVRSASEAGLLRRARARALEFLEPFRRRVV